MHFLLLLLFSITLNGRAILDPIGGDALAAHGGVRTSAIAGDKGLGVDPNG
jgi:hypothetical protein